MYLYQVFDCSGGRGLSIKVKGGWWHAVSPHANMLLACLLPRRFMFQSQGIPSTKLAFLSISLFFLFCLSFFTTGVGYSAI